MPPHVERDGCDTEGVVGCRGGDAVGGGSGDEGGDGGREVGRGGSGGSGEGGGGDGGTIATCRPNARIASTDNAVENKAKSSIRIGESPEVLTRSVQGVHPLAGSREQAAGKTYPPTENTAGNERLLGPGRSAPARAKSTYVVRVVPSKLPARWCQTPSVNVSDESGTSKSLCIQNCFNTVPTLVKGQRFIPIPEPPGMYELYGFCGPSQKNIVTPIDEPTGRKSVLTQKVNVYGALTADIYEGNETE